MHNCLVLKPKITLIRFIRFHSLYHSLSFVVALFVIRCTTRCHSLYHSLPFVVPLVVIRCHSLYRSLPLVVLLVVTRCHSLSFVVTRCTTRCHSLLFVVTRCYSLSFVAPLVVTRCTTRCHSLSLFVIRCHLLYHSLSLVVYSLSLVVIRCHFLYQSLSLVVTRCTTRLSFYKRSIRTHRSKTTFSFENCIYLKLNTLTRCHSLSLDVRLVCLFINDQSEHMGS